jgi:hypothetical protein
MSDICKVSDSTRVVGKCLRNVSMPCFGSGCVWVWRNIPPNRARFFVRKKSTTFSTERIVPLRFVNKIFPESYDFAASIDVVSFSDEMGLIFFLPVLFCINQSKITEIHTIPDYCLIGYHTKH